MENENSKSEKKVYTLLDTFDNGLTYKDYKEVHQKDDPIAGNGSEEYYDWLRDTIEMDIECFFDNLEYSKVDTPVMITGTLGLWDGSHTIQPVVIESEDYATHYTSINSGKKFPYRHPHYLKPSIMGAIKKCISGMDNYKIEFDADEGVVVIYGYHHDGTNVFKIHKLSEKGIEETKDNDFTIEHDDWFTPIKIEEIC